MGKTKTNIPVKLVCGMLYREGKDGAAASGCLRRRFGPVDFESVSVPFTQTGYYQKEMGSGLRRKFFSFRKLIAADSLSGIKLITNRIETALSADGRRKVNLDPGYLDLARLVLASTKDFSHRIYISRGIYAEITLLYDRCGTFRPLEWTYPDYRSSCYLSIFERIRSIYYGQISAGGRK